MNSKLDYIIQQIKRKIDILEIAKEHLQLKKRGQNYFTCCPFHGDKTPSFSVNPQKKIFYCFGCKKGGDIITLYAKLNNITNGQAIFQLGKKLGINNGKPLSKEIEKRISKSKEHKNLKKFFSQNYDQHFYFLCNLREFMKNKAKICKNIDQVQTDLLLVNYYHEQAYHEHLLDKMLIGILKEESHKNQITIFEEVEKNIKKWEKYLKDFCERMN